MFIELALAASPFGPLVKLEQTGGLFGDLCTFGFVYLCIYVFDPG